MKLNRVTITGADDSTDPAQLVALSQRYPFAEWGILISAKHFASPRFPSRHWLYSLCLIEAPMQLSLHICGRYVRSLLKGETEPALTELIPHFQRVQLNFHADSSAPAPDYPAFAKALRSFPGKQFIFQFDGASGQPYFDGLYEKEEPQGIDCVPLYDVSGGAGIVPREWPKPEYLSTDCEFIYHGYAGGLGPENLPAEINRIADVADCPYMNPARIWIDMETKVRSDNDRKFDLDKVRRVLEIAEPMISK